MVQVLNTIEQPGVDGDNVYNLAGTVNMTGDVTVGGDSLPSGIAFAQAAGAANVAEVTVTVQDGAGDTLAGIHTIKLWLSDDSTGISQTGTTASGTVTAKTASGTVLDTLTAKKSLIVQTKADGTFVLEITDTAKTGFYVSVVNPYTGLTAVSAEITAYGA